MPAAVAEVITTHLTVPTIGIGAGVGTSGQVRALPRPSTAFHGPISPELP